MKYQPFTLGQWSVKVGMQEVFIAEWKAFAEWTTSNQAGAGVAYLLQNRERPQKFVSFGPWDNLAVIHAWRERPEFKAFVQKVKPLCEDFQPQTLHVVAQSSRE